MLKQVIFLFGQPGAGKGTQAELLSEKTGYYHFESSKVIEHCLKTEKKDKVFNIEGHDYVVADEIRKWETGELNSPPFVVFLMLEKIKELSLFITCKRCWQKTIFPPKKKRRSIQYFSSENFNNRLFSPK